MWWIRSKLTPYNMVWTGLPLTLYHGRMGECVEFYHVLRIYQFMFNLPNVQQLFKQARKKDSSFGLKKLIVCLQQSPKSNT